MRYRAVPSDLTATTAIPSIATQHRVGILFKSIQYVNEMLLGNHEEAAAASIRYAQFATTLKDAMARKQSDKYQSIQLVNNRRRSLRANADLRDEDDLWNRF